MKARTSRNLVMLAAFTLLTGTLVGCDSSTAPIQEPIVFESEIAAGGRNIHPVMVAESGTLQVQFTRIEEKPVEGFEPLDVNWALGVGVGRPAEDMCPTSYTRSARVGDLVVLGLNEADYCFVVFDTGFLPDVRILEYTLMISPGN